MGSHYDFELTVNTKEDAPESVIRLLSYLMGSDERQPTEVPADWDFDGSWEEQRFTECVKGCSPIAGDPICSFRRVLRYTQQGTDHYQYTLHLRFSAKFEYIIEVALPFASWLAKWSSQNECVGSYKDEFDRHPTLLYFHDGQLYLREVTEPPESVEDGTLWT